ncbi:MAG: TonB-dependent receptor [Bdellovibrionia bacterium]
MLHYLLALIMVLINVSTVLAADAGEEIDTSELANASLEELMKMEVTTASKKQESIYEAPAIINVISSEEIKRFGGNNLKDILNRVTSLQTLGSSMLPGNVVSIRGQALQHENNHVLILINGRPLRESQAQGLISGVLSAFPINLIDKIEVIRGPGSVLYGSSAFSGIINVKTKSAKKMDDAALSFTYGSFDTKYAQASASYKNEDWDVVLGARALDSSGWDYTYTDYGSALGLPQTSSTFKTNDGDIGTDFVINYKDFKLNGFFGRSSINALHPSGLYPTVKMMTDNFMLDFGYQNKLGGNWTIKYNTTFNSLELGYLNIRSKDLLAEINASGSLEKDLDLMIGTRYENFNGEYEVTGIPGIRRAHNQQGALYAQLDYRPSEWLKLTAGAQYNKPEYQEGRISPRAAVITNFYDHWGVKLLHGDAFRSPTFIETVYESPGIIFGNPNLRPEIITTSEIQVFYHGVHSEISLGYYHSKMTNLIKRVGYPIQFVNSGEITFDGIELEGKTLVGSNFSLFGNTSLQTNRNELDQINTTFSPHFMAKLGATFETKQGIILSAFDSFFGNPTPTTTYSSTSLVVNRDATAYHLATFNASMDINRFWNLNRIPLMSLTLLIDNLFNEAISYPDINAQHVNAIPIHSGRAFYGTLSIRF